MIRRVLQAAGFGWCISTGIDRRSIGMVELAGTHGKQLYDNHRYSRIADEEMRKSIT